MKLFTDRLSPPCRFVDVVARALLVEVDRHGPEALPAELADLGVPVLIDEAQVIRPARAIVEHLAQRLPSPMWPGLEPEREVVERWMAFEAQAWGRAVHAVRSASDRVARTEALACFDPLARELDAALEGHSFLIGAWVTFADMALAVHLGPEVPRPGARWWPVLQLERFGNLARWFTAMSRLDAWSA